MEAKIRLRIGMEMAHYAGNLVDGAFMLRQTLMEIGVLIEKQSIKDHAAALTILFVAVNFIS